MGTVFGLWQLSVSHARVSHRSEYLEYGVHVSVALSCTTTWIISQTAQLLLKNVFCHQGEQYFSAFAAVPCLILGGGIQKQSVEKDELLNYFEVIKGEVICF